MSVDLNPGSSYYYRVRSVGIGGGLSDPSNVILVVTSGSNDSGVPVALPATSVSTDSFVANWSFDGGDLGGYDVEHSEYDDFREDVSTISINLNGSSVSISGKASNTIYYYRVKLVIGGGEWSNIVSVSTLSVPPEVYNPIDIRDDSFIALWESIENALQYELKVWEVGSTDTIVYNAYDTARLISDLVVGGTYNYRVRVRNGSGWSEYSDPLIKAFTLLPGVPVLVLDISPGETNFVAEWNTVLGAGSYVIEVSYDKGFNRLLSNWDRKIINDGVDTTVIGLESGYGYYYRVRSRPNNDNYESAWSDPLRQYTMPRVPSALDASEIDGYSFTANWSGNGIAGSYLLDVSTSINFVSSSMIHNSLEVYGFSYRVTGLEPVKDYHYRVRSKSGDLVSENSTIISTRTLLGVPELVDGIVVGNSLTIIWAHVDVDNVKYKLEISSDPDFSMVLEDVSSLLLSGNSHSISGLSYNTYYYYRVRSVLDSDNSLWSVVGGALTSPSAPVVTIRNVTDRSFVLSWISVSRSSYYELDVSEDANFSSFIGDYGGLRVDGLSISVGGLKSGIRYYYRVRSINGGSPSGYGIGFVETLSLETPTGLRIDNITSSSYVASWDDVAGVSGYRSQVVVDTVVLLGLRELESASTTIFVDALDSSSIYYHRVRSEVSNDISAYSNWIVVTTLADINAPTDSTLTGVDNILMSINIYPNPALNMIHLEGAFMTSLEIIDNGGRIVMSSRIDNDSFDVDIESLVSGIYHLRIVSGDGMVVAHKLLKE